MLASPSDPGISHIFQKILVAVDGSQQATWAVDLAGRLAAVMSAKLDLLHVVTLPALITPEIACELPRLREDRYCAGRALLQAAQAHLPETVRAELHLCDGNPADEIVAEARNQSVDLVVMGTRARGRVTQFLLGSTAEAVIRRAICPVLTVAQEPRSALGDAGGKAQDLVAGCIRLC